MDLAAWKPSPCDSRQLLTPNTTSIFDSSHPYLYCHAKWFTSPYNNWCEVLLDVRDMWWGEFQKRCIWEPTLSMTKMRHTWEVKVGDWMRDFLGDDRDVRKRPDWILEMFWE
ncbi:hypothetical protein M9H77_31559 [Catharanthus roseus]|uniref:Uncharacterized protein n=1 Tax=Catharanthus roseus TaxID=4058 RepID=A0ACC0A0G0_CATRO|nr:hypothetical protein M9H77_31559 [Catharanthus roseus]